jgi:parallel beta-helix repeat protein
MLSRASRVSLSTAALSVAASPPPAARPNRRKLATTLVLVGLTAGLAAPAARAESAPTTCDKLSSPQGSDTGTGAATSPFRSAQKLADSLAPGQVGCLRAGTYEGGLRVNHGGAAGSPIVLRSYPGERALITGRLYVPRGSNYVTIANLDLNGNHQSEAKPLPSPTINANHTTFESDDVTNDHTEICFDVGSATYGVADSTVIANNRIHDCGVMPAANHDHGIYVQVATNTRIVDNLIAHNADRGVQLYPSSTGAVISGNVISENGEGVIFSGDGGVASNGNLVEHNLIVNSLVRRDIESWYPSGNPLGVANFAQGNCVSVRGIDTSAGGFTALNNVTASAGELVATSDGGLRPVAGSACAGAVPEIVSRLGAEGAPSGGVPTPVGKEEGGGTTPPPVEEPAAPPPVRKLKKPVKGAAQVSASATARRAATARQRRAAAAHKRKRAHRARVRRARQASHAALSAPRLSRTG